MYVGLRGKITKWTSLNVTLDENPLSVMGLPIILPTMLVFDYSIGWIVLGTIIYFSNLAFIGKRTHDRLLRE
jgi:hypothetical protein